MEAKVAQDPVKVLAGYFLDVIGPVVVFAALNALGISAVWGIIGGAVAALASTARNSVKQGKLDRIGVLVLVEILISLVFLTYHGDPRILAVKPAILLGIAGIYLIANSIHGKPMNYAGARAMATRKDPSRGELFDRTWEVSPSFRRTIRFMAMVWGVGFIVDGTLRGLVLYELPIDRAMLFSNAPHFVILGLLIAASALAGRRMGEIVDEQARAEAETV